MDFDHKLYENAGLNIRSGLDFTGGREKYISAVQRYFKNYEKNRDKVNEYYENKDLDNYLITVHALKSNSRMIGATELANEFEKLELAAQNKDIDIIVRINEATMSAYSELIEKLSPIGNMEEVHAADEISGDEAKDIAARLLEALDDFDDELAVNLARKLAGYPFRITQRDMLVKATEYIGDFMYDEATELVGLILSAIE